MRYGCNCTVSRLGCALPQTSRDRLQVADKPRHVSGNWLNSTGVGDPYSLCAHLDSLEGFLRPHCVVEFSRFDTGSGATRPLAIYCRSWLHCEWR
jgi:hypothetical protein